MRAAIYFRVSQGPGPAPGLRGPAIRTLPAARSTWSWRGRSIGSGAATWSPSSSTCARPWFFLHQPGLDTTTSSRRAMFRCSGD
jgi:hypothetical protein